MAKMLNNIARREFEYSKEFGSVTEARAVSSLLREVAGVSEGQPLTATAAREAIAGLQGTVTAAQESDALLYEGSKTLIDNVVSDLTTQGKLEALGKLLTPFVEATREHDPAGFVAHQRSLFLQTAHETGMSETLNAAYAALSKGDSATAMSKLKSIGSYFNELQKAETDKAREAEIVKRETAKLTTEKSTQASAERTQFQTTVAKTCESHNNKLLGAELGPYLKQAYFKGWGRENLMPLGNTLKQNLYAALKQDQSYQAAMKKMWAAPKPDQSTIEAYHKAAVLKLAKATVEKTIKVMYPNYKPSATAAAGRVDAAKAKAAPAVKETPVGRNNRSLGTAEYVTTKPTNLIHGKDWELLMIAGKGFVPDGKGGSKLITWRRT
jgi:hypothetical protein